MLCSEACLVNHGLNAYRGVTLRCRCWSCDNCLPMRKARLIKDIVAGQPSKFLTLTTKHVEGGDPVAEARRHSVWLARYIKLIKKYCAGEEVAYFVVREAHESGWPHIHIVLRCPYIKWKWLRDTWEAVSGSPGVVIKAVYLSHRAAGYIAKYIGKDPMRFGTTKRYWRSKNWFDVAPERKPADPIWNSKWWIVNEPLAAIAREAWFSGYELTFQGGINYFEARKPP